MRVAHVSTFPPLNCGIAFYVSDLIGALLDATNLKFALHYGQTADWDAFDDANVNDKDAVRRLARRITQAQVDVICLQHEFGIWGGSYGEYIFDFLDVIDRPLVTTFHTTFPAGRRPRIQEAILERLMAQSAAAIVISEDSRKTLAALLNVPPRSIHVVPHGIPEITFKALPPISESDPFKLVSFGFFRPDKGIEHVLAAVKALRTSTRKIEYLIAGSPQEQFSEQEVYFNRIRELIDHYQLNDAVILRREFLTRDDQIRLIREAHAGVFAYQDACHASSGAVALTLGAGRPVVCTPFEFARATADEAPGVFLANNFDATAIKSALAHVIAHGRGLNRIATKLHSRIRSWTWPSVAKMYTRMLSDAHSDSDFLGGLR